MALTIEWLRQRASSGILRMDLDRGSNHSRIERIAAEILGYFWDEEGECLGLVQYDGRWVLYTHTTQPDEYATFIGDMLASWAKDWRVEVERSVRHGRLHRSGPSSGEGTETRRTIWERVPLENVSVLQHLCRLEGAMYQAAQAERGDASSLLLGMASQLDTLIHQQTASAIRPFAPL